MNITFLGAAKTVTGSNFLVEAAGKKFLVDCGMYQGKASQEMENAEDFLYNPETNHLWEHNKIQRKNFKDYQTESYGLWQKNRVL